MATTKKSYEKFGSRNFVPSSTTIGDGEGDILFLGGTSEFTVVVGKIYYMVTSGSNIVWTLADSDSVNSSKNMLGVALGTGLPSDVGMLIRGVVTVYTSPGTGAGIPLYLSSVAGKCDRNAPTSGIVRVIGYNIETGTNGKIFFNPDATYVEIDA
jgi:hypothetical protein